MADIQKIYGLHAAQALINARPDQIVGAWVDRERKDSKLRAIIRLLENMGIRLEFTDKKMLEKLSSNGNHQGIVLTAKLPQERTEEAHDRKHRPLACAAGCAGVVRLARYCARGRRGAHLRRRCRGTALQQ